MVMELILIRHGETDWNKDRVFRGQMDMRMNAAGMIQADATAEALKDKVFDAIYSSPLKRALVTARRIAKPHEIEVRVGSGFNDMHLGSWQGLTEAQAQQRQPKLLRRWLDNPGGVRPPGGESPRKAWKRVNGQLREVLFTHGTGTIVVVSHRLSLKMMTAYLLTRSRRTLRDVKHDPCAISVFKIHSRWDYEPVVLNDSSHLAKLDLPKADDF